MFGSPYVFLGVAGELRGDDEALLKISSFCNNGDRFICGDFLELNPGYVEDSFLTPVLCDVFCFFSLECSVESFLLFFLC